MSLAIKAARARQFRRTPMGDPGLFGFINSVAKGLSGLPVVGGVANVVDRLIPDPAPTIVGRPISAPFVPQGPGVPPAPPGGQIRVGPITIDPLGAGAPGMGVAFGPQITAAGPQNGSAPVVPSGYHLNKTGYFLKDGTYVAPRSRYVKNRRRNPLNPRALSRALSRLDSAKKAATVMQRFSIRKPKRC